MTTTERRVLLAGLLFGTGCLAPVLHQVEIAELGQVTASVSGQMTGSLAQGEAQAAVGVLPHVQVQASASFDPTGAWGAEGGVRGQIPLLSDLLSLQVAGVYGHQSLVSQYVDFCLSDSCAPPPPTTDTALNLGSLELGAVGRLTHSPRAVSWGVWVSEGVGTQSATTAGQPTLSAEYHQTTLSTSAEIPFDDHRHFSLLVGVTSRFGANVKDSNSEYPESLGVGAGMVARF